MKRGDVFTAATGSGFGSKPRPVVVVQSDAYIPAPTILVALVADRAHGHEPIRPTIVPDPNNGLKKPSVIAADVLVTVRNEDFGQRIGLLSAADMARVDAALMITLGFA